MAKSKQKPIILCVDDHREVLDSLEAVFKENFKDYKIEVAESGEEALEYLQDMLKKSSTDEPREVPVVISDYVIVPPPRMYGHTFLAEIRKLLPSTKRILLSGQAQLEQVSQTLNEVGLFGYVVKTAGSTTEFINNLTQIVRHALDSYYTEKKLAEKQRKLELIYQMAQTISEQENINLVIQKVIQALFDYTNSETIELFLYHEKENEIYAYAKATLGNQYKDEIFQSIKEYPCPKDLIQQAIENKQKIVFDDASTESQDRFIVLDNAKSVLLFPMMNLGQVVGLIYLNSYTAKGLFTTEIVQMVEILANAAGVAIINTLEREKYENVALSSTQELAAVRQEALVTQSYNDKMIQIVSHDIRSPLSGISGLASLLQEPDTLKDQDQIKNYGKMIQNSTSQVIRFVEDILDLAKLQSGKMEIHKRPLKPKDYLEELVKTFEPLCLTKEIKLKVEIDNAPEFNADSGKLAQAINNIISNAIKFTKKGGSVTLKANPSTLKDKAAVQIDISDTGMGIPKEELSNIFEKFNKFQRMGSSGEKGTGLGMSIAKEVVELHEGQISVDSTVGVGTTFTITLPCS